MGIDIDLYLDKVPQFVGTPVTGRVVVKTTSEISTKSLYVQLWGQCVTRGTRIFDLTLADGTKGTETRHLTTELLLPTPPRVYLWVGDTLPAGEHEWTFSLPLDYDLPSTYFGENGEVGYTIRAKLKRPTLRFDQKTQFNITIHGQLDEADAREIGTLNRRTRIKSFTSWKLNSGKLEVSADAVPAVVGIADAKLDVHLHIKNGSSRTITRARIFVLMKEQTWWRDGNQVFTSNFTRRMATFEGKLDVKPHTEVTEPIIINFWDLKFPAPTINNCENLRIEYSVNVKLTGSWDSKLELDIPIRVGASEDPMVAEFAPTDEGDDEEAELAHAAK
ncbi:hypothetical protein H9P43_006453 [Blastocladiella emersonii ATCC 22665]|nr:hypothetical protein H9P43_006453 [Blastocladiella emersonii ATCC 22665]